MPRVRITALAVFLGLIVPCATAQQTSTRMELTVVVVNAHVDPAQPVEGVRVSLSFVSGAERVSTNPGATNREGQALLYVLQDAAKRGDLRIEIGGISDLVVYEPADGQISGNLDVPSLTVHVKLLPKQDPALMGPAQIYAMLHRLTLQSNAKSQEIRALKGE